MKLCLHSGVLACSGSFEQAYLRAGALVSRRACELRLMQDFVQAFFVAGVFPCCPADVLAFGLS